jgi:hypothetical protein
MIKQETLVKLELQMRDGRRQVEQDVWRVSQDNARIQALVIIISWHSHQRQSKSHWTPSARGCCNNSATNAQTFRPHESVRPPRVSFSRQELLNSERKAMLTECQEERRLLARERAEINTQIKVNTSSAAFLISPETRRAGEERALQDP